MACIMIFASLTETTIRSVVLSAAENIVDNLIPSDSRSEIVMEVAKDLLKQWNEIYGNAPKSFLELYNSAKFSAVHDALQQLARDSELTAEKFAELNDTDIDGIEDFKKELVDIGEVKQIVRLRRAKESEDICSACKDHRAFFVTFSILFHL